MALLKWFKKKFINDSEEGSDDDSDFEEEEVVVCDDEIMNQDDLDEASLAADDHLTNDEMSQNDSDYDIYPQENYNATKTTPQPPYTSRSRSSSTASTSTVTYSSHQPYFLCSSCESCRIARYKVNPFTDIQVVSDSQSNSSMIKTMITLMEPEDTRDAFYYRSQPFLIAGGCDDGTIIVFDIHSSQVVSKLIGHRLPITCMVKMENKLVTASHDKSIKIWNYKDGTLLHTCNHHKNAIKCIAVLDSNRICSGGNDVELCIWNIVTGELLTTIERNEEECLNSMIALDADRICTASDSRTINVYHYNQSQSTTTHESYTQHDHPVQCIIKVNDASFVSASLDGLIHLWDSTTFQIKKTFNRYKLCLIPSKTTTSAPPPPSRKGTINSSMSNLLNARRVTQLTVVNEKYLCAAIGRGFNVFDLETGTSVLHQDDAHRTQVDKIIILHKGNLVATISNQGCEIKIWNALRTMKKKRQHENNSPIQFNNNNNNHSITPVQALLLSQEALHVRPVKDLIALGPYGFASCGDACEMLIWRDARMEKRCLNKKQQSGVKRVLFGGEQE